jgi:uncharacterized protein YndB with AHSA1/START domain
MTVTRRSRKLAAPAEAVWAVIADPHHLPRWWPGVTRVEGVGPGRFTQVVTTRRGRPMRVDFRVSEPEPGRRGSWSQEVLGTPFERVLAESVVDLTVDPADGGTLVTLEHRQRLKGWSRTGGWMVRRASGARLEDALDGLERVIDG